MSSILEKARVYTTEHVTDVNKRFYPKYHIAPQVGWMNDPNGLCFFKGYYHVFYQHHPYDSSWGPMHWGHYRSKDLVNWEALPIALAPEGTCDESGCFSGSAIVHNDKLYLVYTGHKFDGKGTTDDHLYQVQCLASSEDGVNFERHGMIIDTPQGFHHFRDPKVFRHGDEFFLVVGARDENDVGQVRLYSSQDMFNWHFDCVLSKANNLGFMWECPDFFKLGDKYVLMFSPQGVKAKGYQYRNLFQSGYILGTWQPHKPFEHNNVFHEIDAGHDFYAPQSFEGPDGRRLTFGWMDMWESNMPEKADNWAGMLTICRELTLKDGKILTRPVKEMELLHGKKESIGSTTLKHEQKDIAPSITAAQVDVTFNLKDSDAEEYGIKLGHGLEIYVDNQAGRLFLSRQYDEFNIEGKRSVELDLTKESLTLNIFFDTSSVEVFDKDGTFVLSSRIYPQDNDRALKLFARNGSASIIVTDIITLKV